MPLATALRVVSPALSHAPRAGGRGRRVREDGGSPWALNALAEIVAPKSYNQVPNRSRPYFLPRCSVLSRLGGQLIGLRTAQTTPPPLVRAKQLETVGRLRAPWLQGRGIRQLGLDLTRASPPAVSVDAKHRQET